MKGTDTSSEGSTENEKDIQEPELQSIILNDNEGIETRNRVTIGMVRCNAERREGCESVRRSEEEDEKVFLMSQYLV